MGPASSSSGATNQDWTAFVREIMDNDQEVGDGVNLDQQLEKFRHSEDMLIQKVLPTATPEERKNIEDALKFLQDDGEAKLRKFKKETNEVISQTKSGSLATRKRLRQKHAIQIVKRVKLKTLDCEYLQKEIQSILLASRHFNVQPDEVTEAQKFEYAQLKAEAAFSQLLEECNATKKKEHRKGSKKKKPIEAKSIFCSPEIKKSVSKIVKSEASHQNIFNDAHKEMVTEHGRVRRWATKNLMELRAFQDKVEGQSIFRYAGLSDEELILQRTLHYLPGVENLIAYPEARQKYTFKTQKGYGLISRIIADDEVHEGILYLGVEAKVIDSKIQHKIYHRYFEKLVSIANVFSGISFEKLSPEEEREEDWHPVGKFSLNLIDQDLLEILYNCENYKLLVYPLSNN